MLELDAVLEKSTIEAGERTQLHIRVHNGGDDCKRPVSISVRTTEPLTLAYGGPFVHPNERRNEIDLSLPAPLRAETYDLAISVCTSQPGDAEIVVALECNGERYEQMARCAIAGVAAFAPDANRVELFENEAAAGETVSGRAILTNTGSAAATILALHASGELCEVAFDARFPFVLEPGTRSIVGIRARVADAALDGTPQSLHLTCRTADADLELGESHLVARNHPRLEGSIEAVESADLTVAPGQRVDWCLRVVNAGGAHADFRLGLHVAGGVYLPGSTRIEGARLLERGGTSPLWSRDGMGIEGLRRGEGLRLEFATIADAQGASLSVLARACCQGRESLFESPAMRLCDCGEVPTLPFTVADVALRSVAVPTFAAPPVSSGTRMRRSPAARLEASTATYLNGLDGLMRHLWALAVLCADACDDQPLEVQLAANRIALRSVFDRLAIKLRMPHYPVLADDVLDPAAEDALDACGIAAGALGARLANATQLIAAERDEYPEFAAYRTALRATLEGLHDDATLIDALVAAQPALDARLDAVVEHETGVRV